MFLYSLYNVVFVKYTDSSYSGDLSEQVSEMVYSQNHSSRRASPEQVLPNPLGGFGLLPFQTTCESVEFENKDDRNGSFCGVNTESDVDAGLVPTEINNQSYSSRRASPLPVSAEQQVLLNPLGDTDVLASEDICPVNSFGLSSKRGKDREKGAGKELVLQSEMNDYVFLDSKEKDVEAGLVPTEIKDQSYTSRRASPKQVLPNPLVGSGLLSAEDTCLVDADTFSSESAGYGRRKNVTQRKVLSPVRWKGKGNDGGGKARSPFGNDGNLKYIGECDSRYSKEKENAGLLLPVTLDVSEEGKVTNCSGLPQSSRLGTLIKSSPVTLSPSKRTEDGIVSRNLDFIRKLEQDMIEGLHFFKQLDSGSSILSRGLIGMAVKTLSEAAKNKARKVNRSLINSEVKWMQRIKEMQQVGIFVLFDFSVCHPVN